MANIIPARPAIAMDTLTTKNLPSGSFISSSPPANAPTVRARKYTLFPIPAFSRVKLQRSISTFGKVTFIPTSTPTSTSIPMKNASMYLSFRRENVRPREILSVNFFSSIGVAQSHIIARNEIRA